MKKKIYNWLFRIAKKVIAINIVKHGTQLTPQYLIERGWIEENGYYVEPNIKDRDRISISFGPHYYRVFHGKEKTFIALETNVEWLEIYYFLAHVDNENHKLTKV